MTASVVGSVRQESHCLDQLRDALAGLDDRALVQALRDVESLSRRAHSVMLDMVAEIDARRLAGAEGFGSTARLVAGVLRLSAGEARTRVEHATLVGTRRGLTGEVLAPRLPVTAAGLAAGRLGVGQLRVITETVAAAPEPVRERMDADLAGYGQDFDPGRLRLLAGRMLARLDADGPEPAEPVAAVPARGEVWLRDRRDGRLALEGWLDPEHGTMVRSLIEQLAAPRPGRNDPSAEGAPDARTTPQRQADALIELCERARGAKDLPTSGGEPPHLTVTITWEALRTAVGSATLGHVHQFGAADARRIACDCTLIPVVLGSDSEPLDVGRATRTVPRGIRRALVARDRGCAFPGCDRPPQLCAAHHVRHWADGGLTSVSNCCLLCTTHHRQVHLQGWEVTIHGGRVAFRPPPIIDPDRRPLTNPLRR